MTQCFVTGGSGFVGRNLIPQLVEQGYRVRALARSSQTASLLKSLGAEPIRGDLAQPQALRLGLNGCQTVFHLAASVDFWADEKNLWADHVTGTETLLSEARSAGVHRFIYLSAASVIMNGKPILNADETTQSNHLIDGYSRTKLLAEKRVLASNSPAFTTIAIRPPLIWGKGDSSALPQMIEAADKGQFAFINGGAHQIVTCHVLNVCHALVLAARSPVGGEAFFVTDGEPQGFKSFITALLQTQNVDPGNRSVPLAIARFLGSAMAGIWRTFRLKGHPPLYPGMINTLGLSFIVSDAKIRQRLGYQPVISVSQGLSEMRL
ncbi:NAD-dependent epimerase/dehydratase family protein [Larkinella sp. VNQ87]|uniref:NAD-dependent epimerase/dehydratase family protein n=1 Tax=Larkinella sp. VNQ87 TaxID=3400921 RepID=UPI003C0ACBEA